MKIGKIYFMFGIILFISCSSNNNGKLKQKIETEFGLIGENCTTNTRINLDINNKVIQYFEIKKNIVLLSDTIKHFNRKLFLVHKLGPYIVMTYSSQTKSLIQIYFENCKNEIILRSIKEIRDSSIIYKESSTPLKVKYKNVTDFFETEYKKLSLYDFAENTHGRSEYYYKNCELNIQLVHYWMNMTSRTPRYNDRENILLKPLSYNGSAYLDISMLNRHDLDYDIQLDTSFIGYPKIKNSECNQ